MNKMLFATLLLSTSVAHAHHLPVTLLPATSGALHAFHADCRVASDPEAQVRNGVTPNLVPGDLPDDESEPDYEVAS